MPKSLNMAKALSSSDMEAYFAAILASSSISCGGVEPLVIVSTESKMAIGYGTKVRPCFDLSVETK